jgi:hypothetical protein
LSVQGNDGPPPALPIPALVRVRAARPARVFDPVGLPGGSAACGLNGFGALTRKT